MQFSRIKVSDRFAIKGRVAVITGGAGLLGVQHAIAVAEAGGIPILWDINEAKAKKEAKKISKKYSVQAQAMCVDITNEQEIRIALKIITKKLGRIDILINNAACDPKVSNGSNQLLGRLENFNLDIWNQHLMVGLTGSFLCSKVLGAYMADHKGGAIVNISSDLGLIAPDQRIYRKKNTPKNRQPVKPITYSVVKHGLIGLTKYLATYWAENRVRVNAICPGGVLTNQPREFVDQLTKLIPLGRMAKVDEYRGAIQFLISDASIYMTGSTLVIDGGRTTW